MADIFISYRRDDTAGYAGRIHDLLSQHFSQDAVFRDIEALQPGIDFVKAIQHKVPACSAVLVLIGKHWLTIVDESGRRLNNHDDYVRMEIETALKYDDIRVIPVLVSGATMPHRDELPSTLAPLAHLNSFTMHEPTFKADTERLVAVLNQAIPDVKTQRLRHLDSRIHALVHQILETIPHEPRRDIIDRTFLAIEQQSEWHDQYKILVARHDPQSINPSIAQYVRTLTGFANLGTKARPRSKLIRTYSELG